jgi:uncharacterized membrane protein YbhN (UPF0104 family)
VDSASTPGAPTAGGDEGGAPTSGPAQAVPSRRAAILRSAVVIGVLVVVFGVIIPKFVDYDDVVAAFRDLTLPQLLLMTAMGVLGWVASGLLFNVLIKRLTIPQGTASFLILGGIGASIPLGPWNMGILWVVVRGWGVPVRPATSGIGLYGVLNTLGLLALPALAVIALLVTGNTSGHAGTAFTIALIGTAILLVVGGLMLAAVRSDRTADWLAGTGQRVVGWVLARLGRPGAPDIEGAIHRFRDQVALVVQGRGPGAFAVSIGAKIVWSVILIVALRVVGVPDDVLTPLDVFAVFALVGAITIIPIAPGGAGIPELLYIGGMTTIAGTEWQGLITAGVFLFRLYQWFLPIPIAWILLKVTRRGRPVLPTTAELRSYAHDEPAPSPIPEPALG